MKQIIIQLFIIAFATIFTACSDFLEPKSNTDYVPKDVASLNEILLGEAYYQPSDRVKLDIFCSILDDDVSMGVHPGEVDEKEKFLAYKAAYTWNRDMFLEFSNHGFGDYQVNNWKGYYQKILGANAVLDYIDDAQGLAEMKVNVKAQALALRAFYHFMLVNLFAPPYQASPDALGVPIRATSGLSDKHPQRATVKETYQFIVKDLLESEKLYESLSEKEQFKRDYRVNLPTVRLLLSRVYLFMEDWTNASLYAQKVISDNRFELVDLNALSPAPYNFISFDNPEVMYLYGSLLHMFEFATARWKSSSSFPFHIFKASDKLVSLFEEKDLRKEYYLNNDVYAIEHQYTAFSKCAVHSSAGWISSEYNFGRAFRISEAYLNQAEAELQLAKTDKNIAHLSLCRKLLTELLAHRFERDAIPDILSLNENDLESFLRDERRRELCFEGFRWFDLRRYGMPKIEHVWSESPEDNFQIYTLEKNDPRYTLPIPNTAKELNEELIK